MIVLSKTVGSFVFIQTYFNS